MASLAIPGFPRQRLPNSVLWFIVRGRKPIAVSLAGRARSSVLVYLAGPPYVWSGGSVLAE